MLKNRTTAVGVAIIDRRPSLPGSLVVELGTNDSPDQSARFAGYVRHVLQLAGPNRCVVWVNIHRPPYNGISYAGFNRALDQIAASSSNLAVVDWNGMVNSGRRRSPATACTPTPAGYQARAAAIAQALDGLLVTAVGERLAHDRAGQEAPSRRARSHAPKPKPRPAAKPKAIKVYTPQTAAATTPPTQAAPQASDGGTSPWLYVLLGGGLIVVLGLAWRWRRFLRTMRGPRWPT